MSDIDFNKVYEKLKERDIYSEKASNDKGNIPNIRILLKFQIVLKEFCERHKISFEELEKTLFESKNLENLKNDKAIFNLKEFIEKLKNKFDIVVDIKEEKFVNNHYYENHNRLIKTLVAEIRLVELKKLYIIINIELSSAEKNYYLLKILSLYILDLIPYKGKYIYYLDLNDDDFIFTN